MRDILQEVKTAALLGSQAAQHDGTGIGASRAFSIYFALLLLFFCYYLHKDQESEI
jgi:hypothetical protein